MAGVYSVAQVNAYIRNMFAQDFALNRISVRGEVSNCKYHSSGHIYFTLKDEAGTLAAVMFASARKGLAFELREGMRVVVSGSVEVYERDGKYQLYAKKIEAEGTGDLFERFCKLRDELQEMGMFDPAYKQQIPKYAKKIGVVTASTGAAVRDIMNIASRRNPYTQLVLHPALVQGEGAKASIVQGIRTLDAYGVDVIIVGRGGGSIEDLWAFNEEVVARAVFECRTPVISAVGHETDVTITDYVADLRAPTPSAAAELAVFDYRLFMNELNDRRETLTRMMQYRLEREKHRLASDKLKLEMKAPDRQIANQRQYLVELMDRMKALTERKLLDDRHRLAMLGGRLHGLSPLEKISKGYGFITDERNHRIESISQVAVGDEVEVRIHDGSLTATVTKTREI